MLDAIAVVDDIAEVAKDQCVGCGLYVTACPEEAISLQEREGYREPADSLMKMLGL